MIVNKLKYLCSNNCYDCIDLNTLYSRKDAIKDILDLDDLKWNYVSLDKDLKLREIEPLFVRMVL